MRGRLRTKVYWFGGVYPSMACLARHLEVSRQAISHAYRWNQKVKGHKVESVC